MCVIVHKPKEARLSFGNILDFWCANPHGAGIAWLTSTGSVRIRRGFTEPHKLWSALKKLQHLELLLHFRTASHGGVHPTLTQPFPLSSETRLLRSLKVQCDAAIAHNGILPIDTPEGISDTMLLAEYLGSYRHLAWPILLSLAEGGNNFALIVSRSGVTRFGRWRDYKASTGKVKVAGLTFPQHKIYFRNQTPGFFTTRKSRFRTPKLFSNRS